MKDPADVCPVCSSSGPTDCLQVVLAPSQEEFSSLEAQLPDKARQKRAELKKKLMKEMGIEGSEADTTTVTASSYDKKRERNIHSEDLKDDPKRRWMNSSARCQSRQEPTY